VGERSVALFNDESHFAAETVATNDPELFATARMVWVIDRDFR
jgi:hypothetical protein